MEVRNFRALTKKNNVMVFGDLINCPDGSHRIVWFELKGELPSDVDYNLFNESVQSSTVGRNTSLKDKNGVEIYDGDLYKPYGLNKIFQVFNKNGAFCGGLNFEKSTPLVWIGDSDNTEEVVENLGFLKNLEVVGNIHSNPELLNQ